MAQSGPLRRRAQPEHTEEIQPGKPTHPAVRALAAATAAAATAAAASALHLQVLQTCTFASRLAAESEDDAKGRSNLLAAADDEAVSPAAGLLPRRKRGARLPLLCAHALLQTLGTLARILPTNQLSLLSQNGSEPRRLRCCWRWLLQAAGCC